MYVKEMLCQVYIFNFSTANTIIQEAYLANALLNLPRLSLIFYIMDLLLKH